MGEPSFSLRDRERQSIRSVPRLEQVLTEELTISSGFDKIQTKPAMAQAELYGGPHPDWLRDVLVKLPNLQSLLVSQLPFFDHASLLALRNSGKATPTGGESRHSFPLRLLIATQCTNTTQKSLANSLLAFPHLVFLDLSRTLGTRDAAVLSTLRHMASLQILKLCGIQLRDEDLGVLAESIGIRVRSLDVRNNLLTDNAVRTLLQCCFPVADNPDDANGRRQRDLSGAAEEDWPSGVLKPDPAVLDEFRDESFGMRYLRRLTHGLVSRMPSEDQAHAGITHLYISDNYLTVEGLSGLIRSGRLHVLDAGPVCTTRVLRHPSSSDPPYPTRSDDCTFGLPGAEKLTLILAKHASKNLTSLRVDHRVVTKSTMTNKPIPEPGICELSSDTGLQELPVSSPVYELPTYSDEHFELAGDPLHIVVSPAPVPDTAYQGPGSPSQIKRDGAFSSRTVRNQNDTIHEEEGDAPVLTATGGLGSAAQAINGILSPINSPISPVIDDVMGTRTNTIVSPPPLSLSIIAKQRQDLQQRQASRLHGLLPTTLPQLRSLTLTGVLCYDDSGQVIDALVQFIRYCASEAELAKLQVDLESKYSIAPQETGPRPARQTVEAIFALRTLTLEMGPPNLSSLSTALAPGSPQPSRLPNNTHRTKSSTEDADSEAFWAAQANDFSFFDDEEECGLPSVEPGSRIPLSTISEKMIVSQDDSPALPPNLGQQQQQTTAITHPAGKDVIQELVRFRKDRKAAFENALKRGERTAEGYWPGEVKVIRWQGGKTGMVDYYGNQFENGHVYR
ncbi:MAG: hypothetical protein Q9169_005785 [Polycauliona sp. 2 TL-2023]